MNKNLYRIVFNRALGVLQVVAEVARGSSGGATGTGRMAATLRPLGFAMWVSLGWVGVISAASAQQAQGERVGRIVSDRDAPGQHRPTVLETPDGVPLVNITTPSEAGVSRNVYSQFDVDDRGAVLNNSRTAAQTQLAGWVEGNPWLATGTARVILNEVNSADPSYLHGYVEVAGDRAQVVIANPAGIQVDGGGFLNASRATLTTGSPIIEQGALTGYRAERGTIRVTGAGLDATHTDYTDLIARSIEVNAGIWAQQLQATTGRNTVSVDHAQVAALTDGSGGNAPSLALDVSALGGMYAGKIALMGTEHGLGVRNAGGIGASAGELTVTVDGRLENTGTLQSTGDTGIEASGGVENAGTLAAARELSVSTPADLDNSGKLNAGRIDVAANSLRNHGGAIEQTGAQRLALDADHVSNRDAGRIGVAAPAGTGTGGDAGGGTGGGDGGTGGDPGDNEGEAPDGGSTPPAPGTNPPAPLADGLLDIAGVLDNDGGRINAGGGIDLRTSHGLDNSGGYVGLQQLVLDKGELVNEGGQLTISGAARLHVGAIDNDGGLFEIGGPLDIDSGTLSNRSGTLTHGGEEDARVQVSGTFDNTDGTFGTNAARLELDAGIVVNEAGRIEHAGVSGLQMSADTLRGADGVIVTAGAADLRLGEADHRGATLSATRVTLQADGFDNTAGQVVATGTSANHMSVQGLLDNGDGGRIASAGDLHLQAGTLGNAGGAIQHAGTGTLSIDTDALQGAGGTIASNGALLLTGGRIDLGAGDTTARQIDVQSTDLLTAGGSLLATGDGAMGLQVSGTLDNTGGTLATNGGLVLAAGELRNRDGQVHAAGAGDTAVQVAGTFDNAGGTFATAGDTRVDASQLLNAAGTVQVAGDASLLLDVEGLLDNGQQGTIAAGGDMELAAGTLDNSEGRIEHAGEGLLAIAAQTLEGQGGTIAGNGALQLSGESTRLQGGTTQARSISIQTGSLSTAGGSLVASGTGPLDLQVRDQLDNDGGIIATNGVLDVDAGAISNRDGTLQSAGAGESTVDATGLFDNTGGTLATAGDATIHAGSVLNSDGAIQTAGSSGLDIEVEGLLDNSDAGLIASGGDMHLAGGAVDNTGGRIEHAGEGTLELDTADLRGSAGTIISNGTLGLGGEALDLAGGETIARRITIDAGSLSTAGGTLISSGTDDLEIDVERDFDNTAGQVATNGGLVLSAGHASNRDGLIQSAGAGGMDVHVTGLLDNAGGAMASTGDATFQAGELANTGGSIQTAGESSLQLDVDGRLDNSDGLLASAGDTTLTAGTLDNAAGRIEHAGTGELSINAETLNGAEGLIASNGALTLAGESTVLRDGTTQAQQITVDTGTLVTAGGSLVAGGEGPLKLQVRDTLDNNGGSLATNGALELTAGTLGNRDGSIQAAGQGATGIHVAGTFDNTGGALAVAGDTTLGAGALLNSDGSIQTVGDSTLSISVEGLLDNSEAGLLASGGDTAVAAGTLDNRAGRIEHAGTGLLDIDATTLEGAQGTIASNGALSLTGDTTRLQGATTSAQSISIDTGDLTTADGLVIASGDGPLQLKVRDSLDNDGGTLATNGALNLVSGALSNRGGTVQAAGTAASTVDVTHGIDNTGGTLVAAGDTTITAAGLLNAGGTVQAADASGLQVTVDGLLDNSGDGRVTAGGDIALAAVVLDNTDGRIEHAGEGALSIDADTLDGAGGTIASNGALTLSGDDTNLRGGTTHARQITVDTGTLTTAHGSLIASGEGPLQLRARDALDNEGGMVATNGALDLVAGSLRNTDGLIQAAGAGASQVQVAGQFDNDGGTLATAGDTLVTAAGIGNAGGTLQTIDGADLQVSVDGLLDNDGGLVASGGDMALDADTLANRAGRIEHAGDGTLVLDARALEGAGGTIVSNASLELSGESLDLSGGETVARSIAVDAGSLSTAGGTLIASGDDALELDVRDTFDNTGGTVATNGALQLTAGSATNRDGTLQATGNGATGIQIAGALDNSAGTITTAGATTIQADELLNSGGVLQAASDAALQVSTDGRLVNDAGVIQGNGDIDLQAGTLSNRGGAVMTQRAIDAAVGGALDNTGGSLVAGEDLAVTAGTLVNRNTLDAAGEQGLFGQAVSLDVASLDNTRGRIGAGESLTVETGSLVNAAGSIDAEGTLQVDASSIDNNGGALVQRGSGALVLDVTGAITNTGDALIGAEGTATLRSGTLDNSGGTVFARQGLDIASDGQLLNRNGGLLQSNAALALDAGGAFDNSGGMVDATGAATVAASRITNTGGQMLAGQQGETAGLTVSSAGALDNRGGTTGSRGGDLRIDVASIDNRNDGVLVAGRDMTLDTGSVNNTGGTVYATRNLRYENSAAALDNTGGQFGAGSTAWLDLADIDNSGGGRIQAGTLWLTADTMDNDGGEAGADILHADIANLSGSGRLYGAQWLDLVFSGDYTFGSGEQLESGNRLDLTVLGTFTNQGTLESAGDLNLTAGNVINQGTINASNAGGTGVNRIHADGSIDNRSGGSIEGDTVELVAGTVTNTGDIIGDFVDIEADRLTNGRDLGNGMAARDYGEGFIGAADYLELRIGQRLSNLDAELFSGGDLVITGRDSGASTTLLENVSGRIQAEGDVFIAADRIDNVRRVLDYEQRVLTPEEQEAMTQVLGRGTSADTYGDAHQQLYQRFCPDNGRSRCIEFRIPDYTEIGTPTEGLFVTRASAASMLVSGGDMTLEATTLRNRHSAIAAGEDLLINGSGQTGGDGENAPGVLNESLSGEQTWDVTADYWLLYQTCPNDLDCHYEPREMTGTLNFGQVTRDVYPEEGRATITAGNSLTIISGGDVNNSIVNVSDGLDGMGPGAVGGPGTRGLGSAGQASAGSVGAAGPVSGGSASSGSITDAQTTGVASNTAPGTIDRGLIDGRGDVQGVNTGRVSPGTTVAVAEGRRTEVRTEALDTLGEWINGSGNPLNAAPQLVGSPDRPLPGLVPPDNGMFDQDVDPNAPFLVTTAPRFVPDDTIGSDYLTGRLGGGSDQHKRLGDNYYEQRMVLEQLLQLTGRRTLDGSDGMAQYRTLMDNAAGTASQLGLALGMPLTAVQIASLDRDIVWLVEQVVDGQKVLVPVVYLSRATAERLRADGALIAAADVGIHSDTTVRNDGTVSASQGMWLSADTLINDGTLDAGTRLAVSASGDVRNRGAMVARDGDALVQAGRDFVQTGTGSLAAAGSTVVDAGRDLRLKGTTVSAGDDLVLAAGRDMSVTADTSMRTIVHGNTVAGRETLQATELQAGGNLVLQADRDMTLQAAQLQAGENVAMAVGRDLELSTVTTTNTSLEQINGRRFKQRTETMDETVHGTNVQAVGDVTLSVGRDATLTAAQVVSEQGGIAIAAGRDLTLAAAEETHHYEQDTVRKKSGMFSSKTTTTHDESTATYAIGTTLSGETVDLAAGNDLTLQAATVAGTGDVALVAGNDITIETAQNTVTESHSSHTRKSGLFGTGGIGFTIGKQTRENTADINEQTHTGSLIGSTDGRVDIVAGGDVAIAGSDVLSKAGIGITGENVTISSVENSLSVVEAQKFRQAGLNVSLRGGVVDTAMAVYGAAKRADEVEDDRLKTLYAAQAGQTLFSDGNAGMNSFGNTGEQFGDLTSTNQETEAKGNSGLSLRIGIGASKSDSEQTYTETTAHGSRIASEGDVAIVARSGDVSVTGSQIEGDNVTLAAARDLILQSAQENSELRARDQSSSGEIGITIGTEAGIGVYVSAHAAKGAGDGGGNTHAETTVTAGDTLTLVSGRDTTLEGAQAIGERVVADVGRNLTMTSQQDSNDYERHDKAGGIDVAVGMGGGSVSGYYNQSDIDSTYTSVREQTGIQAGAGGFDIQVGGHTELTGAAIASTADAALNRLSTESLSVSDLHNQAAYEADSFGVSASSSGTKGQGWSGGVSPSVGIGQSESASSTTRSGISAGTLEIRGGDDSAVADLDRELIELEQSGLGEIFDEQKVAERMEMGRVAGEVGMRAAGDLADQRGWEEGSTEKVILHGVVGAGIAALGGGDALQGLSGAAANQLLTVAMLGYLDEMEIDPNSPLGKDLMELGSLAVGAAVGGASGASTALNAEQFNRQLHSSEMSIIEALAEEGYSEEELMAVACAMVQCLLGRGLVEPAVLSDGLQGDFNLTPAGSNLAAQYQQVLDTMTPAQQQAVAEKLAATGKFQYGLRAAWGDAARDVQFGTRMDGLAQSVLGTLGALGTSAFCTFTAGWGCAVGGGAAAAESADNITAGLTAFYTGRPTLTLQNQAWQAAGLTPDQATAAEALTGLGLAGAGGWTTMRGVSKQDERSAISPGTTSAGGYVDLLSPEARKHILYGDKPGSGGHLWPGQPGKTPFPQDWSGDKIVHEVSDIATSPSTRWYAQTGTGGVYTGKGEAAKWVAYEVRDGVRLRVVYQPATGRVITAFPDDAPVPPYKPID